MAKTRIGYARGSGTDAIVSMTVYGENGNSGNVILAENNAFKTGATDVSQNLNSGIKIFSILNLIQKILEN